MVASVPMVWETANQTSGNRDSLKGGVYTGVSKDRNITGSGDLQGPGTRCKTAPPLASL